MTEEAILKYVIASADLLGLPLEAGRAARVAAHLGRTEAMAALLEGFDLAEDAEIAEIYCPAAFLPNKNGREQL
jgi:hypothetical protein